MRDRRLRADAAPDRVVSVAVVAREAVATYSVQVGASQVVRPGQTVPLLVAVRFVQPGLAAYLDEIVRNPVVRDAQVVSADAVALTPMLGKAEGQAATDGAALVVTFFRDFAGGLAVADQVALTIATMRQFPDAQAIADAVALALSRPAADAQAVADAVVRAIDKALADEQRATDLVSWAYAKARADAQAALDAAALALNRPSADAQAAGDGGVLVSQDYVEPGYFDADYVGTVRSF